ncbi:hypothetical protein KCP71_08270 [Salmonella enterica subsp. enterica]|nr:hypothetical protein KCP71_08270 [Salmonella enterica subsp. enterica]
MSICCQLTAYEGRKLYRGTARRGDSRTQILFVAIKRNMSSSRQAIAIYKQDYKAC